MEVWQVWQVQSETWSYTDSYVVMNSQPVSSDHKEISLPAVFKETRGLFCVTKLIQKLIHLNQWNAYILAKGHKKNGVHNTHYS